MAAPSRCIGKRLLSQISTSKPPLPLISTAASSFRRATYSTSDDKSTDDPVGGGMVPEEVYEKNRDDLVPESIVPDEVIQNQSEEYWVPHPQTGVFVPPTDRDLSEDTRESTCNDSSEVSVLEQEAFFRSSGIEDPEKPIGLKDDVFEGVSETAPQEASK